MFSLLSCLALLWWVDFVRRLSLGAQETLFQVVPDQAESCAWFNRVIVRIMMEYRASDFEEKWRQRMNRRFAEIRSVVRGRTVLVPRLTPSNAGVSFSLFFFFFFFFFFAFIYVDVSFSDKPPLVGDIVMEKVDFSNSTPEVQPIKLLKPKAPYEIRAEW